MKRIITLLTAVALLVAMCCTTAVAENPGVYKSTRLYIDLLEEQGVNYRYEGIDEDGDELVIIPNTDDEAGIEYELRVYFESNNENAFIRVWDVAVFDESRYVDAVIACNNCHLSWKYAIFMVVNETSVTAGIDFIFRGNSAAEVCWEGTLHLVNIISGAYTDYLGALDTSR